jgi:transposase
VASTASSRTSRAATAATAFSDRRQQLQERLRQGPGPQPQAAPACDNAGGSGAGAAAPCAAVPCASPAPASNVAAAACAAPCQPATPPVVSLPRWTLQSIRGTFDWLKDYTLSGVWRYLGRHGLKLRSARVQQFSPDPDYQAKLIDLEMALWEAHRYPQSVVAVFIDEMGFSRWPDPGPDWGGAAAVADRRGANNGLWRLIGGLNALTGRVNYLDNYIVGRAKVTEFYGLLVEAYPKAEQLYVIQDNWSIHKNPEVLEALKTWPQVQPLWLPTYAPWLNPIEKLWRWLRQDVLTLHRLADDWKALRGRVRLWLEQFKDGSQRLLEYVGLLGNGLLARMIHGP